MIKSLASLFVGGLLGGSHFLQQAVALIPNCEETKPKNRQLHSVSGGFTDTEMACADRNYNLSVFVDTHMYLVAVPAMDVVGSDGDVTCAAFVFHSGANGMNVMEEIDIYEDLKYYHGLPISTLPLHEIVSAFNDVPDQIYAEYDILFNNCANFCIEMGARLGLFISDEAIEYVADQLHANGVTIDAVRSHPNVGIVLGQDGMPVEHVNDYDLLHALAVYYGETETRRVKRVLAGEEPCQIDCPGLDPDQFAVTFDTGCGYVDFTCGRLRKRASRLNEEAVEAGKCAAYKDLLHIYCGCDKPDDLSCPLCEGGSEVASATLTQKPEAAFMSSSGYRLKSCSALLFSDAPAESDQCMAKQFAGLSNCGCLNDEDLSQTCKLCGDKELPDPSLEVFPLISCGQLEKMAQASSDCGHYQKVFGPYCGCGLEVVDACRLCGTQTLLSNPYRVFSPGSAKDGSLSCVFYELLANADGSDCVAYQEAAAAGCCDESPTCFPCFSEMEGTADRNTVVAGVTLKDLFDDFDANLGEKQLTCGYLTDFIEGLPFESLFDIYRCIDWKVVVSAEIDNQCGCVLDYCAENSFVEVPSTVSGNFEIGKENVGVALLQAQEKAPEESEQLLGVWYRFTGTGDNMKVTVSNHKLQVFEECIRFEAKKIVSQPGSKSLKQEVVFKTQEGKDYYIFVWKVEDVDSDTFRLTVNRRCRTAGQKCKINDHCCNHYNCIKENMSDMHGQCTSCKASGSSCRDIAECCDGLKCRNGKCK